MEAHRLGDKATVFGRWSVASPDGPPKGVVTPGANIDMLGSEEQCHGSRAVDVRGSAVVVSRDAMYCGGWMHARFIPLHAEGIIMSRHKEDCNLGTSFPIHWEISKLRVRSALLEDRERSREVGC